MKLFEPTHIPFKTAYPELREHDAFEKITDREYAFIWNMGCKDSPFYGLNERDRLLEAFKTVPDFAKKLPEDEYKKYVSLDFPEYIKLAIEAIGRFEPELRYKVKVYTDRYLEYANKVTSMNIEDFMGAEGMKDLKSFMDMQTNIAKELPSIIRNAEQGFGFSKKGKEKESQDDYKVLENL